MSFLEIKNITYYYPDEDKPALENVSFTVKEGEFLFLTGPSGCGKSSLLRAVAGLLPDYYGGSFGGDVLYKNRPLRKWNKRQLAREIGLIFQNPEQQTVMTMVEQEVAFGLENLGISPPVMRRRVAEALSLFGLSPLRREPVFNLSGGEKQKVCLAAILAMHPRVLLLDEPTSQLDPVAAQELLHYVHRVNREWGITVILVEQRVDRCFHLADRVALMDRGRINHLLPPGEMIRRAGKRYSCFIPPVSRVFTGFDLPKMPLTIKEGRAILENMRSKGALDFLAPAPPVSGGKTEPSGGETPLLEIQKLEYAYPGNPACLKKVDLQIMPASISVILGENGAGKSTLLKNINGLLSPRRGKIFLRGADITAKKAEERSRNIGYLSQYPEDYLFNDTVLDEIAFGLDMRDPNNKERVNEVLAMLDLLHAKEKNPRDLSGGEKQRVALGTVLAPGPAVVLLDEPTRGLDMQLKQRLCDTLNYLKSAGTAILLVTHDVEFAAEVACRVIIMSSGEIVAVGEKREILSSSLYYSPQVNRMFRDYYPGVMTVEEGISAIRGLGNEVVR